jgi:nitrous oxidase accessory protein
MKICWLLLGLLYFTRPAHSLPSLQIFLDVTPPGGTLKPLPGTYAGPLIIRHPITLDGQGQVIIDAQGEGTVLTIKADGAVVRNLHLANSGDSHDQVDAGILVQADDVLIEDNTIENSLFGIHLQQANGNTIRRNRISSKPAPATLRGDGIRMWYSRDNLLLDNQLTGSRDMVFANSPDNRIIGNSIRDGRIGMEFIFSPGNEVRDNEITGNVTGIVVIYSDELSITGNRMLKLRQHTGFGLSIKESSQVVVENNEIVHCAIGFVVNAPVQPENITFLRNNLFAYNEAAMFFYGDRGGHVIQGNRFENNHTDVLVSSASSALDNKWLGNIWDSYEGFDQDQNGIGDTPHNLYIYADRLWMDTPMARFYRGTPALELVDFVERLAPFSEPHLILQDAQPSVKNRAD